jgi:hypothetical protein
VGARGREMGEGGPQWAPRWQWRHAPRVAHPPPGWARLPRHFTKRATTRRFPPPSTPRAQTHIPDDLGVYDFFDGLTPLVAANGTFSTGLFTEAALARLTAQAAAGPDAPPLYLYLAMQNIHVPLQAPPEYVARYPPSATGNNTLRAAICAMIAYLDDAVGNVTAAVTALGLDGNTIVIFASDNGGPTNGAEGTEANNFPLRGGKNTIWEGGTRVAAMVKGPGIPAGVTTDALVHVTDWLPSLVSAAGGGNFTRWAPPGEPAYLPGDGLDVWATIASGGATPSPRDWVLLEAHPPGTAGLTHGDALLLADPSDGSLYKVIANGPASTATEDGWWPPPGQDAATTPYTLRCDYDGRGPRTGAATSLKECAYPDACVYNLTGDPCEYHNIAAAQPALAARLHAALAVYQATAVPPTMGTGCKPRVVQVAGSAGGNASAYRPCDAPPLPLPGPSR